MGSKMDKLMVLKLAVLWAGYSVDLKVAVMVACLDNIAVD